MIDRDASAEAFILRMTGDCTYLYGEPVLPKCSLLYERFCVLNELNGVRWSSDGDSWHRLDFSDRQDIMHELFERKASVTYRHISDWLASHNRGNHPLVRGGQGEAGLESKLTSHRFFAKLLGTDELAGPTMQMVEEIILWNTLFEDRDILKERITCSYGPKGTGALTAEQVSKICRKRFSGWGRLSRKLLCEVRTTIDGRSLSIMDVMVEGSPVGRHIGSAMVFMEVLRDSTLGFAAKIDAINKERAEGVGGLSVEDMPGSPALRRSVNQALRIVEEIARIAGGAPASVYIETTRDDDPKKRGRRTARRYERIEAALRAFKEETSLASGLLGELKGYKGKDIDDRLALYFLQNGTCMYSGKPLDIRRLSTYQIDHIIPQSYTKDDSLDNKVLVLSSANQTKSDQLLIAPEVRRNMAPMWRELHRAKMMSDKKFRNLMTNEIGDRQLQGFVARQLVETSQVVKFVRMMLEERYASQGTKVRSIKASLSHQLREAEHYVKCREANDYHHAHDALLAAELGRFIQLRLGDIFDNPIGLEHAMCSYIHTLNGERKKTGLAPADSAFIVGNFRRLAADSATGELLWDGPGETERIRRFLNYKDCYISRMPEITSGAFWDATIYSPKSGRTTPKYQLKSKLDVGKYGGYSGGDYAYFFIYTIRKSNKTLLRFDGVPVPLAHQIEDKPDRLIEYAMALAENEGATFVSIARPCICKKQLIQMRESLYVITGVKEVRLAREIAFSQSQLRVLSEETPGNVELAERENLYQYVCAKMRTFAPKLYEVLKLDGTAEIFSGLDEQSQIFVTHELVNLINGSNRVANLTPIGGSKYAGAQRVSYDKELNSGSQIIIVDQSVTGMFERRQRIGL